MEKPCIKCSDKTNGCPEWEEWRTKFLGTFIEPKKTNFDVLNEFVKKTFGFELDKDELNQKCIIGTIFGCQKRWGGPTCEGCEYQNFWNLEYKEVK